MNTDTVFSAPTPSSTPSTPHTRLTLPQHSYTQKLPQAIALNEIAPDDVDEPDIVASLS